MSADPVAYTLSSSPIAAMCQPEVTELVGLEDDDDGALKVYLGHRHQGVYVLVTDPSEQQAFRTAWASGGHVWMWPLPPAEALHREAS